jgi:hypothetical protein
VSTHGKGKDERGKSPFGPVVVAGDPDVTYTPWLVIRYAVGDFGGRPLPSTAVFWESPDVWVTSTLGVNQPIPGKPNQVFARVSNFGLQQANGVVVKFWWANPSLAITEATANLIGVAFVDIPSLRSILVECPDPWVPIIENQGHECLLAEAYMPGLDPLIAPMDPLADRHVGQKNEQLVGVSPGEKFRVPVQVLNASAKLVHAAIEVHAIELKSVPGLIRERLGPEAKLAPPRAGEASLALEESGEPRTLLEPSTAFAHSLLDEPPSDIVGAESELRGKPAATHSLELHPWETTLVELSGVTPASARLGDTFLYRIVQRVGPVVTGGYTVALVVTAEG